METIEGVLIFSGLLCHIIGIFLFSECYGSPKEFLPLDVVELFLSKRCSGNHAFFALGAIGWYCVCAFPLYHLFCVFLRKILKRATFIDVNEESDLAKLRHAPDATVTFYTSLLNAQEAAETCKRYPPYRINFEGAARKMTFAFEDCTNVPVWCFTSCKRFGLPKKCHALLLRACNLIWNFPKVEGIEKLLIWNCQDIGLARFIKTQKSTLRKVTLSSIDTFLSDGEIIDLSGIEEICLDSLNSFFLHKINVDNVKRLILYTNFERGWFENLLRSPACPLRIKIMYRSDFVLPIENCRIAQFEQTEKVQFNDWILDRNRHMHKRAKDASLCFMIIWKRTPLRTLNVQTVREIAKMVWSSRFDPKVWK